MLNVDYSVASQPRRFVDKINKLAHLFLDAKKGKAIFIFIIDARVQSTVSRCTVARCGNVSQIFAVHFDNTHTLSLSFALTQV